MTKFPVDRVLFSLFLMVCALTAPGYAKTDVPSFNGVLLITQPSGEIVLLNPGEEVPEIPNGATLELFNGEFQVKTQPGDNVLIACLGHLANVQEGAAVTLVSDDDSCLVKVQSGTVIIKSPDGTPKEVPAGEEYRIEAEAAAAFAPPVNEDGSEGPTAGGDINEIPVDSRSIDASVGG